MEVEAPDADEARPTGWVGEVWVGVSQERHLGPTQRPRGISFGEQCPMKRYKEGPTDIVINIPETADDVRDSGSEEGPTQAERPLDTGDRAGRRAAGG